MDAEVLAASAWSGSDGHAVSYVAAQTGIFSFFVNYVLENDPGVTRLQASRWLGAIGFVLFMVGRVCGSAVISQFKPERVLAAYSV